MKAVLSASAREHYLEHGYVRPGIVLSKDMMERLRAHFAPKRGNNWGAFRTCDLSAQEVHQTLFHKFRKLRWDVWSEWYSRKKYHKALFDTSPLMVEVFQHCLDQGLADHFATSPFLVSHDVYLENSHRKRAFDLHEDTWMSDLFFNTDDDVSLFFALQPLQADTGGRLCVQRDHSRFSGRPELNTPIRQLADICRQLGAVDAHGRVTRQAVWTSRNLTRIKLAHKQLKETRESLLTRPEDDEMLPIDMAAGELILFNNKRYHAIEDWRVRATRRSVYVIRAHPLYDLGLHPPSTFLDDRPCHRYLFDGARGVIEPVQCDVDPLPYMALPEHDGVGVSS